MKRYKATRDCIFAFGEYFKAYVTIKKGQIWEYNGQNDAMISICRNNTAIYIEHRYFENVFQEVKE